MVTPSSSVTSLSPPVLYSQPHSPSLSTDTDPLEREERERAIRKFLASAELSVVVRGLRARLSYASYKATHNIPHVPLNDLEAKTRVMAVAPPRLIGTKRKASGGNNYYNNPATQGSPSRRGGNVASSVISGASATGASRSNHHPTGTPASYSNSSQSLFTALLGPPPLKQARTVHNSTDPPVQPPARSSAGSRARSGRRGKGSSPVVRSIAEGTRAQSRSRKEVVSRGKGKNSGKGKQKQSAEEAADVERKAVATLTSLLQSRPSIATVSSPRSSLSAGSESSFQSLSHYAQSSARTTTATSLLPSAESSFSMSNQPRAATPPRTNTDNVYSTPRADDEEAANLMLYLHTSPSPARPTTIRDKDAKDIAAFRALGGGGSLRTKGRVLFPGADDGKSSLRSESSFTVDPLPGSQNSQSSSQTIRLDITSDGTGSLAPAAPMEPTIIPPTPVSAASLTSSQSLPVPLSPSRNGDNLPTHFQAPPTPGNVPFNLNDFINVSPSPAAATVPRSAISLKSGLGANLRTDLGRKLFEEEHPRHQHLTASSTYDGMRHEKDGSGLGASINLSTG